KKEEEERRRKEEEEREEREERKRRKEMEERIRREEREKFEREEKERQEKEEVKRRHEEAERRRVEEIRAEVRREMEAKMRREFGSSSKRNLQVSKALSSYGERERKAIERLEKLRRPLKSRTDDMRVLKILPGGDFSASGEERSKKEDLGSLPDITEEEFTLSPIEKRNNLRAVDELQTLLHEREEEPFAAARGIKTSNSHVIKTTNEKISASAPRAMIKSETEDSETFLGGWDEASRERNAAQKPKGLNVRRITQAPSHTIAPLDIIPNEKTIENERENKVVEIIEPTTKVPPQNKISLLAPIDVKPAEESESVTQKYIIIPPPTAAPAKKSTEPGERTVDSLSDAEYDKFVRDYYSNYYKDYYSKLGMPGNDSAALTDYYKKYYETYYTAATPTPFGSEPAPATQAATPPPATTSIPNLGSGFGLNGGLGGLLSAVIPPAGYGSLLPQQPSLGGTAQEQQPSMGGLAGIEDPRKPGQEMTEEMAQKVCAQMKTQAKNYGIKDISGFAKKNCIFIQSMYPGVTCPQIEQVTNYCESSGLLSK
ncbi:hypothetical protein PMAYCL1PPCAC_03680, partial [Pristionchus mayeri]